jgi:monoamine oxidase
MTSPTRPLRRDQSQPHVVVVGSGAAGHAAARALRHGGYTGAADRAARRAAPGSPPT